MNIGASEIFTLFILALLLFGPKKLPEIGRNVGKALGEMRRMSSEVRSAFEEAIQEPKASRYAGEWDDPEDRHSRVSMNQAPEGPDGISGPEAKESVQDVDRPLSDIDESEIHREDSSEERNSVT